MNDSTAPRASPGRSEVAWVLSIVAVFFLLAAFTNHEQLPWGDEVLTVEPAFNSAMGYGFMSYVYNTQDSHSFYAGNVPAYPFALSLWLRMVGVSIARAHLFNYLLVAIAVCLIWLRVRRNELVVGSGWRILLVACLLSSAATGYAIFNLRYDAWAILLAAVAFYYFNAAGVIAPLLLFLIGFLMPFSGVHLLPSAVLLSGVLALFRIVTLRRWGWLFLGGAIGQVSLVALYRYEGVWGNFIAVGKQEGGQSLAVKLARLGYYFHPDATAWFVVASLLLFAPAAFFQGVLRRERLLLAALTIALFFPPILFVMRRFQLNYAWVVAIPTFILLFGYMSRLGPINRWNLLQKSSLGLVLLGCVLGNPRRLLARLLEKGVLDDRNVSRWVAANVPVGAHVVSTSGPFFAAKERTRYVYFPLYFKSAREEEQKQITVMLLDKGSGETEQAERVMGTGWKKTGEIRSEHVPRWITRFSGFGYDIEAYQQTSN